MKKIRIIDIAILIGVIALAYVGYVLLSDSGTLVAKEENFVAAENKSALEGIKAEKIQVFLFHATQRCSSCINIGKFAGETVSEYFQQELKDGKIEFKEINIDLPENRELAEKFKAAGSVLYINVIAEGKDNIEEDTMVWRLTTNNEQFKSYLKDKLNKLFGK